MHDVKRSSLRRRLRPLAGASVLKYCFLLPAVVWIVAFSIFRFSPRFITALRWTPFVFLISLAGLGAIPDEMYEAALLESSDYRQLMVHIAVPLSWPVVSVALLLRLIEGFKSFGLPLALTGGGPGTSTQLFSMLNYFTTIQFFDFGTGSAMAVLYLCFVSAIVALFFRLLRKGFD